MKKVMMANSEIAGYMVSSLRALADKGAEVVCWAKPETWGEDHPLHGRARYYGFDACPTVNALLAALGDWRPDLLLCGGWADRRFLELSRRLREKDTRTVLMLDTPWQGKPKQWLNCVLGRFMLRPLFDFAWGAGKPQTDYMRRVGFPEGRLKDGMYAADSAKFAALYAPDRDPWPHTFLYIGRYVPVKNMRRMERAFLKALERAPGSDWRLCCIGGGPLWDERTQHPRIEHLGYKSPQEIQRFIPQAGCFVLPSVFEPWGVVVQEAAQMGLPLLCSNVVQATTAFLEPGKNGFTFDPQDEDAIAQAMCRVMALPDDALRAMGRESHRLGMAYTTEDWAERALSFLD